MKETKFNIVSFREFKDSYKKEVIQNNIGKTKYEIDVILEEMYIAYINRELNINVSTLKEARYKQRLNHQKEYHAANRDKINSRRRELRAKSREETKY